MPNRLYPTKLFCWCKDFPQLSLPLQQSGADLWGSLGCAQGEEREHKSPPVVQAAQLCEMQPGVCEDSPQLPKAGATFLLVGLLLSLAFLELLEHTRWYAVVEEEHIAVVSFTLSKLWHLGIVEKFRLDADHERLIGQALSQNHIFH